MWQSISQASMRKKCKKTNGQIVPTVFLVLVATAPIRRGLSPRSAQDLLHNASQIFLRQQSTKEQIT
jgi:hypothetical protein